MGDKNADALFEYLRSILYDAQIQTLDPASLDEPFQKLGKGLNYLEQAVTEMKDYSAALSRGNLSVEAPSRENFLCENLKNIHANLNHLTWQAKQVAKGDYSQNVSYLGEFSEAFNTMTEQLHDREQKLKEEAEQEKTYANLMEAEAYRDTLTGIGNRYFFQEKTTELLASGKRLIFCYCDLDHLKYINDRYGHVEGDCYIRHFVETVKHFIRREDIFARLGGDEFCIVLEDCPRVLAEEKVWNMQRTFSENETREYPRSFSCGIVEIPEDHREIQVTDIIEQADAVMYREKRAHKEKYKSEL